MQPVSYPLLSLYYVVQVSFGVLINENVGGGGEDGKEQGG